MGPVRAAAEVRADVLVLGGGVAGMACAAELAAAGLAVSLLEARERLGGRIHTLHPAALPYPVELGAEFVHGAPPLLLGRLREAGVSLAPALTHAWLADEHGLRPERHDHGDTGDSPWAEVLHARPPDRTVAELTHQWRARHPDRTADADGLEAFVAGFHAADPGLMGVAALAHETRAGELEGGEASERPVHGYDQLIADMERRLGTGVDVRAGMAVIALDWRRGEVAVSATPASGKGTAERFRAPRAVITLPVGVLRAGGVRFSPVPPSHAAALERLHMGQARRIVLCFHRRFWADETVLAPPPAGGTIADMGFLRSPLGVPPVWWTHAPLRHPVITGWVGGCAAAGLEGWSVASVTRLAVDALAAALGLPSPAVDRELAASFSHDWGADPWSRGAYSFAGVDGQAARRALAAPVDSTLYWAGEATYWEGSAGTVHGALATGLRAASELARDAQPARG